MCFGLATTISAVGFSLYIGPTFGLICCAYLPLVVIATYIFGRSVRNAQLEKREVAKRMGGVIEEILSAVKLISSFAQERREVEKFVAVAEEARITSKRQDGLVAIFSGFFKFAVFAFYMYACWIGSVYLTHERINERSNQLYNVGELLAVVLAFKTGLLLLVTLSPSLQAVVRSRVVGKAIFDVIDRVPEIRDLDEGLNKKDCLFDLKDGIRFEKVTFRYPTAAKKLPDTL